MADQLSKFDQDGTKFGQSAADKISFYGATAISQRAGAAQATSLLSTASSTAIDTQTKAAIIELMNWAAAIGGWKGAA